MRIADENIKKLLRGSLEVEKKESKELRKRDRSYRYVYKEEKKGMSMRRGFVLKVFPTFVALLSEGRLEVMENF